MSKADVIVLGGGPCGLTAARRLHRLGLKVSVLTRPTKSPRGGGLETVMSTNVIAHAFPDLAQDEKSGFFPVVAGVNWWTGEERATPPLQGIDRKKLDAALLDRVLAAGIDVRTEVSSPSLAGEVERRCGLVINAAGRHSAAPRRQLTSWRQVALIGEMPLRDGMPNSWTESLADGWLWAVSDGRRLLVTVFTDAGSVRQDRDATWREMLASSRLGRFCASNRLPGLISCREITPSAAQSAATADGVIHAGDAALARDPLAAQGLTAAISDGLAAAVAASVWLGGSEGAAVAQEFLSARQQRAAVRHLSNLAAAYATATRDEPFWRTRRSSAPPQEEPSLETWSPNTQFVRSEEWSFGAGLALLDDKIVRTEQLLSKDLANEPVAWLAGKPIRQFLAGADTPQPAASLIANWVRTGLAPPRQALAILRWMLTQRVLRPRVIFSNCQP